MKEKAIGKVLAQVLALFEALGYVDPLVAVITGVAKTGAESYSTRDILLLLSRRCKVKSRKAIKLCVASGFLSARKEQFDEYQVWLFSPTELLLPLAEAYDLVLDEYPELRKVYKQYLSVYRRAVLRGRRRLEKEREKQGKK